MIFQETPLKGAYLIKVEEHHDHRGFFCRTWCAHEFENQGLVPRLVQCSTSFNKAIGTLRGMHFQAEPFQEVKLVRCTRGQIYDVIIDLRSTSSTYQQYFGAMLSSDTRDMMYVPEGFAHGFLTLTAPAEVYYQMSEFYSPTSAGGVRWNDPAFGIKWPGEVKVISDKDSQYPDFTPSPIRA